ncbi:MAG: helix-turn-helix transcriptional regulator [Burkholderiales bacterium]|nr:helix-turn-helix transcriptional regulator [Opitutaceae bacterium]
MPDPSRHRLWAELAGDSALDSLHFATLGWVPRKRERMVGPTPRHALCLLARGRGSFREAGDSTPRPVRGPGVFFTSHEMRHDYGPDKPADLWEEYYWIVEGERVDEWRRAGWWPAREHFAPIDAPFAARLVALFHEASSALERRERPSLDAAKLGLERWLCDHAATHAETTPTAPSPLAVVIELWRREPQRAWSLREAAAKAGLSYTRFRARFVEEHGTSPYDYLLQLRLELAMRWLHATDEPVKAVALRCGFASAESFVRAFGHAKGITPGRWRRVGRPN